MALGVTGPMLRSTGLPWDLRKSQPYCGYETLRLRRAGQRHVRRVRPVPDQDGRDRPVAADHRAVRRPAGGPRLAGPDNDPVMIRDAKIGWPARLSLGPDGLGPSPEHIAHIMGQSMEALIHHFKLITEGFRVPAGQAYAAVESPRGELGAHVVSDGGTRPYRVHLRDPSFTHLQSVAAMCEGGHGRRRDPGDREHRSGDGRRGQVMPFSDDVRSRLDAGRGADHRPVPGPRSALLPLLHLVQSEEGYVSAGRHRVLRGQARADRDRGHRGGQLLHHVQAPPGRRLPRRRVHQLAVRGHGRRPDPRRTARAPRRGRRRDHAGRPGQPRAPGVQRRLRLRAGDDGELGVLRQHDPGGRPASWSTTCAPGPRSRPTRGPRRLCTWREASRILAGFNDGQATEGPAAGPAALAGLGSPRNTAGSRARPRPAGWPGPARDDR